jgi:hypothetical protein
VVAFVRRLTGLVLTLVLMASLPIAAVRAACACDHGHGGAAAEAHTCTEACTAETCPMHRGGAHAASAQAPLAGEGVGCSCARDALQLIGHAAPAAIVPEPITAPQPAEGLAAPASLTVSPLGLAPSPPAPPPRA